MSYSKLQSDLNEYINRKYYYLIIFKFYIANIFISFRNTYKKEELMELYTNEEREARIREIIDDLLVIYKV